MTSRRPPSQRNPEFAVSRMSRAIQSMSPGSMGGRVANASPVSFGIGGVGAVVTGIGGDGGSAGSETATREIITYTTGSLTANEAEKGLVALGSRYIVLYIKTSAAARVRLYASEGDQDGDLGRPLTYDPAPGLGIVMDYLTSTTLLEAPLAPIPEGAVFDPGLGVNVPITVTSVYGGSITVTLTYVTLE